MQPPSLWRFDSFCLDPTAACLWHGDREIMLRPKTFAVLEYLVTHPDALATKDDLLEAAWPETAVGDGVLKACVKEIRRALGETAQTPQFIATVHGRGYRFIAPVSRVDRTPVVETESVPLTAPESARRPLPIEHRTALLVERESVLQQLQHHHNQASQGRRQAVFVIGEPGIGKTAVAEAFTAQTQAEASVRVAWGQCVEYYGEGEAYLPVLEALAQLCQGPDGSRIIAILRQQAPTWLVQMPWLLSPTDREVLQHELGGATRARMLRELVSAIDFLTAEAPLIWVFEDLHWSDYATLDLLSMLARRREPAQLLILGTYRPVEIIVNAHPLRTVTQELCLRGHGVELALELLSPTAVTTYLAERFPNNRFPAALSDALSRRTDGKPLFLVAMVDWLVQTSVLGLQDGNWTLQRELSEVDVGVPESLQSLLECQLEQLTPDQRQMLETASVAGVEFLATDVAAGLQAEAIEVERQCDALSQQGYLLRPSGSVAQPDGTMTARYTFQHALYQQMTYQKLLETHRIRLHRRIGKRLESAYKDRTWDVAAELAMHFVRGRDPDLAVTYLRQAAENAVRRHAHREAIAHLRLALEQLATLVDTPERTQHELAVYLTLAPALRVIAGPVSAETEHAYHRARELCQQLGNRLQLLTVLEGLCSCYVVGGQYRKAQALGEQLLPLAQREQKPIHLLEAHRTLGTTLMFLGDLTSARDQLEAGIALYDPQQHRELAVLHGMDLGVICRSVLAGVLWRLGDIDQSQQAVEAALTLAQNHPYSLGFALSRAVELHLLRGELQHGQERLELLLSLAETHGFPIWQMVGTLLQGALLVEQNQWAAGITQLEQGLASQEAQGIRLSRTHWLAYLAKSYGGAGQISDGLRTLGQTLGIVRQTGECVWEPELYRLQGELLRMRNEDHLQVAEVETCFQQALELARQQQAKAWELRAATSLGQLWLGQGRRAAAYTLVAEVVGGFSEGFGTRDLQEAKALLDRLTADRS